MREHSPFDRWVGFALGPYRLEQLLDQNELGPVFAARHEADHTTCLIRILSVPPARSPDGTQVYWAHLERQATHLAALRHPAILPLLDFGVDQGLPYLVWPYLAARSLSARLAHSGPLDVVTAGRYLDQIAGALESAYEHSTIHRNLSADCVFLQLDGHLLVGDFGVRRLVELLGQDTAPHAYFGSLEACAPEQILGQRVDSYTDVYALGALTYRLLTGQLVFTGSTLDEILRQHLTASPPSLGMWRDDVPAGLDGVLAGALAKDPAHRFAHAATFANAYHQIVTPNSKTRIPVAVGGHPGGSGQDPAPEEALVSERYAPAPASGGERHIPGIVTARLMLDVDGASSADAYPLTERPRRAWWRGIGGVAVAATLLVALLGGGIFFWSGASPGAQTRLTGDVVFMDRPNSPTGLTDALHMVVHGLAAPASGSHYDAWLINLASEHILPLGTLAATSQGYELQYPAPASSGPAGDNSNLLALGNKIEVTLEQSQVQAPSGRVVLTAAFPPQAFVHVQHLLVSFPTTPDKIGLLVGMLTQSRELATLVPALKSAAASGNSAVVRCDAQGIIDIIEGAQGSHYHPLGDACTALGSTSQGDGFGLLGSASGGSGGTPTLGYLDGAVDHAALAATQPDATDTIRLYAGRVQTAVNAIKGVLTRADAQALTLRQTPTDAAALSQVVTLCDMAYQGQQTGGDNPSAAGATTAYTYGQSMATLTLVPVG